MKIFSLLFAFLFIAVPVDIMAQGFGRNKVQYDDFDFRSFKTPHFEIFYYPEEKEAVTDAARMAERWYRRHTRTFLREFYDRKPIILYANDADFQQTNVIGGFIGQGTGGVTESLKERVVMPLTGIYSETDHVLGHELVHSFQYDIGLVRNDSSRFSLQLLPLWLVEGMAEYLTVGREDPHTAMWMRDAVLVDDLPTIEDLNRGGKYFPYRYGQAYLAYVGGKYGDAAVTNLFKLGGRTGVDSAFVYTLGIHPDSLSQEWADAIREAYVPVMEDRTHPDSVGNPVLTEEKTGAGLHISPAVSPDGQYVAYLSEQDVFNINLFIADATTGETIRKLRATNSNPHFDHIRFINSAGSWSPDGKKFVFVTFAQGDNELSIWDLDSGNVERRVSVSGVSALSNPAWSPNGREIAFSGIDGGLSDLYVLELSTGAVRQLTNDRYADLHPAWSPDGQTIALVSDRGPGGTDFETLEYSETRLTLIDVASGVMETIVPFEEGKHISPQFSPDGRSLYFVSDQDGFSDIYRYELSSGDIDRITRVKTGISGITALSPTLSVASQNGRLIYTVYHDNKYSVFGLSATEAYEIAVAVTEESEEDEGASLAVVLPPFSALDEGLVADYLEDPLTGLPDPAPLDEVTYSSRLRLDYVMPPTIGASVGGYGYGYGSGVYGGVGFFFSDMLGNKNLIVVAQANGTFKDLGGQVQYMDLGDRFNYGGMIGHTALVYGYPQGGYDQFGNLIYYDLRQRIFIDQLMGIGSYPFSVTRRMEAFGGYTRYSFDYELIQIVSSPFGQSRDRQRFDKCSDLTPEEVRTTICEPDAVNLFQIGAAYVGDFSSFGYTSPLQGGRYRLQVAPRLGTNNFIAVMGDYRRYFFAKPITFAMRGLHVGNYGSRLDEEGVFAREYLHAPYYPGFIRGYSRASFEAEECTDPACSVFARLEGTRLAMASAELRIPLFGTETLGLINFPYLPLELVGFADIGMAWRKGDNPIDIAREWGADASGRFGRPSIGSDGSILPCEGPCTLDLSVYRTPVASVGAAARFNLLGFLVAEVYYAYPFQRPNQEGHFGFLFSPGW